MMKIRIGTPAGLGLVTAQFSTTLYAICRLLDRLGIESTFETVAVADIEYARNYLASKFMQDDDATHFLAIDADMTFDARLIERMIRFDKDFVATIYRKRTENIDFVGRATLKEADGSLLIDGGFIRVNGAGMGVCLIKRAVFEKINGTEKAPRADTDIYRLYHFFDKIKPLTEDYSFCKRWTDTGGTIWACIDEHIGHVGQHEYSGTYLDFIKSQMKATPPYAVTGTR